MAVMKLLLSQARRCYVNKSHFSLSSSFHRYLSSSSDSNPNPNPNPNPNQNESPRKPLPVQTVSYPAKPKEQTETASTETLSPSQQQQQQAQSPSSQPRNQFRNSTNQQTRSNWTREDVRYVKDAPSISPVSYPIRVAPLPEDRVSTSSEEGGEGIEERMKWENVREGRDVETPRKKIEDHNRVMRRMFRPVIQEEKVAVPFPTLIMPEKKQEKRTIFDLLDAIREVKANAKANFDETVEAHVRLGIEKGRSELIVRGTLALPHATKKDIRVAFFAEGADAEDARAAGADIVGGVELIEEIANSGKIDFDRCFSTPQVMQRVYKISRILNHHGLMPNPKQGTVTKDVAKAVREAKQGHTKFRMDKTSIVHVPLGKVSFTEEALRENVGAFMNVLLQAKPAGLKKRCSHEKLLETVLNIVHNESFFFHVSFSSSFQASKYAGYVNAFHICSTMGPGFPVSIQSLSRAADHYNKVQLK